MDTHLDTCSPTCGIEMIGSIVGDNDIRQVKSQLVSDPVLLQGPHVEHSDLQQPHAGDRIQDNLITPKVVLQQQLQVLLKGQWTSPPSALICLPPNTIQEHQGQVLIPINQLAVVNHIVDHHSPKVPVRKIGGQPCSGCTHHQRLF